MAVRGGVGVLVSRPAKRDLPRPVRAGESSQPPPGWSGSLRKRAWAGKSAGCDGIGMPCITARRIARTVVAAGRYWPPHACHTLHVRRA